MQRVCRITMPKAHDTRLLFLIALSTLPMRSAMSQLLIQIRQRKRQHQKPARLFITISPLFLDTPVALRSQ
jgi:hypothetical protein